MNRMKVRRSAALRTVDIVIPGAFPASGQQRNHVPGLSPGHILRLACLLGTQLNYDVIAQGNDRMNSGWDAVAHDNTAVGHHQ